MLYNVDWFCVFRFHWIKGLAGRSRSKVEWHIPLTAQTGTYRIQHFGHYKQIMDNNTITTPYVGTSDAFKVTRSFYYWKNIRCDARWQILAAHKAVSN